MTNQTNITPSNGHTNRGRHVIAATAAIATLVVSAAGSAAAGASQGDDPTGLGAALAVTWDVLPPGLDDATQLGYPEAACATDLRTWILGS